jgi:hypothetical protein
MSKVNEKFLNNRLKAMYGEDFDPIMKIAENASRLQKKIEEELLKENPKVDLSDLIEANKEWERMAQFTTPKLKSVEHTGENQITEVHIHR